MDPDATLRFFRLLRTDDRLRSMYLRSTGCETGFEKDHPGKLVNAQIAKAVKERMKAENEPGGETPVEGEFIQSYQRFAPRGG